MALTREAPHLPRMCLKFRGGKTVAGKAPPCSEALPGGSGSALPFSLKPRHGPSPAAPPLMSNSCRIDLRGIAALPPAPFPQLFSVWPFQRRSLQSQGVMSKPCIHEHFIYDPAAGDDVMQPRRRSAVGGARTDGVAAINCCPGLTLMFG